jgi:multiple sugar transport system permease protein
MQGKNRARRLSADRAVLWTASAGMMALAMSTIFPLIFTLNTSLKSSRAFIADGLGLVTAPVGDNFATAWSSFNIGSYAANSAIATVIGVMTVLIVASMSGFALSHLRFRFRRQIFLLLLTGLIIPVQVIMVPFFHVVIDLGLLNSRIGLGIVYGAFFSPFGIYLMTTYYASLPKELMEAARVDGASVWQIYYNIVLPLGRPALVTLAILTTLNCWNDVLLALLVLQDTRTLMVGIAALQGEYGADIPVIAAAVIVAAAPVIGLFIFFQRRILGGIMLGSVKG